MKTELKNKKIKIMKLKERLKNGEVIEFTNDDFDHMRLEFRESRWTGKLEFVVWLNGSIIKLVQSWKSANTKIEQLIRDRQLVEISE